MSPIAPLLSEQEYHLQVSPLGCIVEGFPSQLTLHNKGTAEHRVHEAALEEGAASRAAPQDCPCTYRICPFSALCIAGTVCDDAPLEQWVWVLSSRMEAVLLHPETLLFFRAHRFHP